VLFRSDRDAVIPHARYESVRHGLAIRAIDRHDIAGRESMWRKGSPAAWLQQRMQRAAEAWLEVRHFEPPKQHAALLQLGFAARAQEALLLRDLLRAFDAEQFLVPCYECVEVHVENVQGNGVEVKTRLPSAA
jgi:hypothetical protein